MSRAGRTPRNRTKFVKLTLAVLCASMIPVALPSALALRGGGLGPRGPSHDLRQAWGVRDKLKATTRPTWLWGDGAFDCEAWHRANWEDWGVLSYAPTTV